MKDHPKISRLQNLVLLISHLKGVNYLTEVVFKTMYGNNYRKKIPRSYLN